MPNLLIRPQILSMVACLALTTVSPTEAKHRNIPLQGLFCNTQAQIDQTLAHIDRGLSLKTAAELSNEREVVCNYVDFVYYVVSHPIEVGAHYGRLSVIKYEAALTGVIVGGLLRPVSPTMRIYFITPEPLDELSLDKRA
jgi:hypothetical protein